MSFNPSPDLHALSAIARSDKVAARLLWNLGLTAQSLWMQQQSAEKYLKILWCRNKVFATQDKFESKLRGLKHNLKGIFNKLPKATQSKVRKPFYYVQLDNLRYKASFGSSYEMFRIGEQFIKELQVLLGEKTYRTHLDEWNNTSMRFPFNSLELPKVLLAIKKVLAITNPKTKKEKAAEFRQFEKIIDRLRNARVVN